MKVPDNIDIDGKNKLSWVIMACIFYLLVRILLYRYFPMLFFILFREPQL